MWLAGRTDTPVVGWLFDEPWAGHVASWAGRGVRPDDRRLAAVATHPTGRLGRGGGVPRPDVAAVRDRRVPVGDDRRHDDLLRAVLAASVSRAIPPECRSAPECRTSRRGPSRTRMGGDRRPVGADPDAQCRCGTSRTPVDVRWTEEGYYGSFRVMLTEKAGFLEFDVTDPATGERWSRRARRRCSPTGRPGRQPCQPTSRSPRRTSSPSDFARLGHPGVEVRADSWVSFNGRRRQRMIDPSVDLAALDRRARAGEYVLDLEAPAD